MKNSALDFHHQEKVANPTDLQLVIVLGTADTAVLMWMYDIPTLMIHRW